MTKQQFMLSFPLRNNTTKRLIGIIPEELVVSDKVSMAHLAPILQKELGIEIRGNQWFSTYHIHHRLAESFKVGNIFLAGDAAHLHSPVGGQGMNAGIADAVNLGWKLAHVIKRESPKQLLYTYQEERAAFAKELVSTTDRVFKAVTADNPLVGQIRSALLPPLVDRVMNKTERLSGVFFKILSQMATQYDQSSLNAEDVRNPLLGARLPYYRKNLDLTDDMTWHVQVYGQITAELAAFLGRIGLPFYEIKWEEPMKKKKFAKDTAYLIRPDGYIAWVSMEQDIASLTNYLQKWRIFPVSD